MNFRSERERRIGMTFDEIGQEQEERKRFKEKWPRFHAFEKSVINTYVGGASEKAARMSGFHRVHWLPCIWISLSIMLLLNCLECFDRADFATTIVGLLSIIFLSENESVNRDHFRFIPVLMLLTIIYDFIWLFAI